MIYLLGTYEHALVAFIGVLFAFAVTCIAIAKLNGYLPKDMGRQYAHDGALSAGKPRGAGIIFVLTFVVSALLFGKMNKEIIIYLVLIVIEMFTGFFDDAAEKPWGEYLKGILDLAVAVVVAISYLHYNSSEITIAITGTTIVIPPVVFAILTVILVWVSINVTNCSDGVDGLSGTLTIITLMSVFVLDNILKVNDSFNYCILLFAVCLLGYLWYNATPSKLLMGATRAASAASSRHGQTPRSMTAISLGSSSWTRQAPATCAARAAGRQSTATSRTSPLRRWTVC